MIKKLINGLFDSLGYRLVKKNIRVADGFTLLKVGRFDIKINNHSGLQYCYLYCRDYGTQLTRLTGIVHTKYASLEVIDIGANQGDSVALIKTGANVPVICVEGDHKLFGQFDNNTTQFENVTLIDIFLSDTASQQDCVYTKVGHNLTITPVKKSKDSVLTNFSTIDSLYQNSAFNNSCKLLKIDTEGFDLKILRGGDKFLDVVKPVILFEYNRDNLSKIETDPFSIFPWLSQKGYNKILFYESDGRFMFSAALNNVAFIKQVYDYIDGKNAKVYYMDIIVFHTEDDQLAHSFIESEEHHRLAVSK